MTYCINFLLLCCFEASLEASLRVKTTTVCFVAPSPKISFTPLNSLLVLRGELAQLHHQEQHVGSWGREQGAPLHLLEQGVRGVLPAKHIWCVNNHHLSVSPAAPTLTASLRQGPGTQSGLKCWLLEDAVLCRTFASSRFAHQNDSQL